jgi:predicted exporter
MTIPDLFSLLAMAVVLCVGMMALWSCRRMPKKYKPVRVYTAIMLWYFFILYLIAFSAGNVYVVRSGILTRTGVIFLAVAIAGEISIREYHATRDN